MISNQLRRNGFQWRNPAGLVAECGQRADFRVCGTPLASRAKSCLSKREVEFQSVNNNMLHNTSTHGV